MLLVKAFIRRNEEETDRQADRDREQIQITFIKNRNKNSFRKIIKRQENIVEWKSVFNAQSAILVTTGRGKKKKKTAGENEIETY